MASLIASSTEIVCALGLEGALVARSHECDYPASVKRLPACTAPKLDTDASSRQIDRSVKAILESALSVYRVDAELLRSLRPTHIVTQTQCQVCAVSLSDVEVALREWTARPPAAPLPRIVSLAPDRLEDVFGDIRRVGEALGAAEVAAQLVERLRGRLRAIEERASGLARPGVAVVEWIDPLMAAGNWMPELVEMAGGRNLFGEAGKHSPWMTLEELAAKDPDRVLVTPCGFGIERSRREMEVLRGNPAWEALRAVREGRVYLADGNQYFNRPGPRLVESLEILAEVLHPERFRFGHEGKGWERWR